VTYLPFYRIHEVGIYFSKNIEVMRPKAAIVYVDNVYHEEQKEVLARVLPGDIEARIGNWRNRSDTWIAMLRDFHMLGDEVMVIDSDNLVTSDLPKIHHELKGNPIYTILDEEAWKSCPSHFLTRSRKIGELHIESYSKPVYAYRVYDDSLGGLFRGGSVFFIGPKQVVAVSKPLDQEILNKVERALDSVDTWLRNFISDETLLGVITYLSSIKEVPWTIASHHLHHGSAPGRATKLLVAAAHYQFAKGLVREFGGWEFRRYQFKYALSMIRNLSSIVRF
jgi:hypothetical protein